MRPYIERGFCHEPAAQPVKTHSGAPAVEVGNCDCHGNQPQTPTKQKLISGGCKLVDLEKPPSRFRESFHYRNRRFCVFSSSISQSKEHHGKSPVPANTNWSQAFRPKAKSWLCASCPTLLQQQTPSLPITSNQTLSFRLRGRIFQSLKFTALPELHLPRRS
jgi:hypothetical protein